MKIPPWLKKILNCGYDMPVSQLKTYSVSSIMKPIYFEAYDIRACLEATHISFEVYDTLLPHKPLVLTGKINRKGEREWEFTKLRSQADLFHKLSDIATKYLK
jgi:hypothetical protein